MVRKTGFYGTDEEVYYLAPSGRTWIVASADDLGPGEVTEIASVPEGATEVGDLLTPEESIAYCRAVERESGEKLIED